MTALVQKVPVLILNPHNRCNCRCVMCDIWKRDTIEEISPERFAAQLSSIDRLGVEWVVFSGGEALMHTGLFSFCTALRQRKIRVSILSSGLLFSRHAREITEHVDDVIVSLDGPQEIHDSIRRVTGGFDRIAAGVALIHTIKPSLPIAARCTVQRQNCGKLIATVESARSIGLRSISFLASDTQSDAFNHQRGLPVFNHRIALVAGEIAVLEEQIDALIASGECGRFILETPDKLQRIAHHFRCGLGTAQPVAPVCNAPWTSAVVEADGTVKPCFFHPRLAS